MADREDAIRALHTSVGTVDPAHAASEGYASAVEEVRKTMRQQGHVMSEALDNNARLWEDRKRLQAENRHLTSSNRDLAAQNRRMLDEIEALKGAYAKLEAQGGDRYKTLYDESRRTINLYLSDALDEDQLRQRRDAMQAQKRQLDAEGLPKAHVPDRAAVDEHIVAQGLEDL